MNLYDYVTLAFHNEIAKYKPKLTFTAQNVVAKQPEFPYVSFLIYNDEVKVGGSNNFGWLEMQIQMKGVSDNENEAKSLGYWLRHFVYLQQPLDDFRSKGIVPLKSVGTLPDTNRFIENSFQFESGADMRIAVRKHVSDNTQPGEFKHINTKFLTERND